MGTSAGCWAGKRKAQHSVESITREREGSGSRDYPPSILATSSNILTIFTDRTTQDKYKTRPRCVFQKSAQLLDLCLSSTWQSYPSNLPQQLQSCQNQPQGAVRSSSRDSLLP